MAINSNELKNLIKEAMPDAQITLQDLAGDGDHYSVIIQSKEFKGLSMIQQHKLVYKALKGKMGNELHALAITTKEVE
jgi:stress-induced morphogen